MDLNAHSRPERRFETIDFTLVPYNIITPLNWEAPKDFPNCCPKHKDIVDYTGAFLNAFPQCCAHHSEMAKKFNLDKGQYLNLTDKIVRQVSYTETHISNVINNDDWLEDITDYCEYGILSFGIPNVGGHIYYSSIIHYVNTTSDIPQEKRTTIIEKLNEYNKPEINTEQTNINVLNDIYSRWLKAFPFDLSYLHTAYEYFNNLDPFAVKIIRTNRYTKFTYYQLHTEVSIIKYLFDATENIFTLLRTEELIEKKIITDFQRIRMELIFNERKLKRQSLLSTYTKGEHKYIKTIKQWLVDEKQFFEDLSNLEKNEKPLPKNKRIRKNKSQIAKVTTSFRPKHNKLDKIKAIIYELNREIYLLNEEKCSPEDLLKVLLASTIEYEKDIHFQCYTNQLAFIIKQFINRNYFNNMTFTSVVNTNFFYSKEGTKFKGNIFSSSLNQIQSPEKMNEIIAIFDKFQNIH